MSLTMTDSQQSTLTVAFKTAAGNPATIDGVPNWAVANPEILELKVHGDPLKATIFSRGPGVSQVTVTADSDLGTGMKEITGALDVEVTADQATTVTVSAGIPMLKLEINPLPAGAKKK